MTQNRLRYNKFLDATIKTLYTDRKQFKLDFVFCPVEFFDLTVDLGLDTFSLENDTTEELESLLKAKIISYVFFTSPECNPTLN